MPEKTITSRGGSRDLRLAYGGARLTGPTEVNVKASTAHDAYYDGPALRDALLEAFPLEKPEERLAEWEKELLEAIEPEPVVVPGMVFRGNHGGWDDEVRVATPGGWYNVTGGRSYKGAQSSLLVDNDLVFDPRDARALPNPLGIRVGDTVRRVKADNHGGAVITTTVEFKVNHIDGTTGFISPINGYTYRADEFEVISREVPDRLPAGTITRTGRTLRLVTADGWINLRDGTTHKLGAVERDATEGRAEVIYLP